MGYSAEFTKAWKVQGWESSAFCQISAFSIAIHVSKMSQIQMFFVFFKGYRGVLAFSID